jgi:steroid delta-isomerase-like uncharacterized protein
MSTETNKATVRRFYAEYIPAVVDELFTPDYMHHDASLPPEMQRGREAYKQLTQGFLAAFPDITNTVEDQVAEGDKVVSRVTVRGTQHGELMGMPPSGKAATFPLISIHRFADGKIAECWIVFDTLGMLQQLGAIPGPMAAAS